MGFLKRKKTKYLFLRFILLLVILGIGGFFFFNHFKKASAEWFDSSWFYRKAINITNSGTAQTDYQVSITLDTATLITANKLQSDCDDIRITDINGKLLPHWIETGTNSCNTATTAIWTKVPSVPTSGQTVYLYYGNPNATNVQNGNNVFLFFDDFSGSSLDAAKWTANAINAITYSVAGGKLRITNATRDGGTYWIYNNTDTGSQHQAKWTPTSSFVMEWEQAVSDTTASQMGEVGMALVGSDNKLSSYVSTTDGMGDAISLKKDGYAFIESTTGANSATTSPDIRKYQTTRSDTSVILRDVTDNVTIASGTSSDISKVAIAIGAYGTGASFFDYGDIYYTYVRKYAATEPTNSAGSEEKGTAPVAYWKFDEGTGTTTYDESSNNNDGTISGATWQTEDMCVTGKCLKFDGTDDYVDAGSGNSLNITEAITLEAWIKPSNTPSVNRGIVSKWWNYTAHTAQRSFDLTQIGSVGSGTIGTVYLSISTDGTTNTGKWNIVASNTVLSANKWYHVVGVYVPSTSLTIYVNGVAENTITTDIVSSIYSSAEPTKVGVTYDPTDATRFFNGFIDDVKIYPYARTAEQIKADYNAGKSGAGGSSKSASLGNKVQDWMTNGLVGYWKMDELSWNGTAGEVIDSSGAGNNGVRVGGATTVSGKFGNGGTFDGTDDYANLGNISAVNGATVLTISAWAKDNGGTQDPFVAKYGGDNNNRTHFWYNSTDGLVYWNVSNGSNSWGTSSYSGTGWHHYVMVFDGSRTGNENRLKGYIDGVQQALTFTGTIPSTATSAVGNLRVGRSGTAYAKAYIDEVRIYNRTLSSKEVSDLYNWAPGPVGWWKMDDKVSGNSQTLIDSSTYGNNGTTYYGANTTGMNCKIIGKFGGGCLFDGVDDYVNVGSGASLDFGTGSFTIEGWGKWSQQRYSAILARGYRTVNTALKTAGWALGGSHAPEFGFVIADGTNAQRLVTSWNKNEWAHWAGVRDTATGKIRLYKNGTEISSATDIVGSVSTISKSVLVGADDVSNDFFKGSIDDVRVYNYARTQKQIMEDMNAGHPSVGSPVGSYAGYWKFDEGQGSTAKDQSVNANNGTISGATWTNDGKFGKALNFNGTSSYVNAGTSSSLNLTSAGSYGAWIKVGGGAGTYRGILAKGTAGTDANNNYELWVNTGNDLIAYLGNGVTSNSVTARTKPTIGNWYYVVVTFDGSNFKIYVNGVLEQTASQTITPVAVAQELDIGRVSAGYYFLGVIDEVKVYPFALTADEIKTEYNQGKSIVMGSVSNTSGLAGGSVASNSASAAYCIPGDTATCNPPVGEWKFEEAVNGNSKTVYDTSGNGNNGTTYYGANGTGMDCRKPGKYGTSCQFDGVNDYIDAGNGASLNLSNNFTIESWVKFSGVSGAGGVISWGEQSDGKRRSILVWNGGSGTNYYFYFSGYNAAANLNSNTIVSDNRWHHLVATVDGSNYTKVYVDGVLKNEGSLTLNSYTFSGVNIGRTQYPEYFNGLIDDVKVFNYVRTPAQIAWDYNKGKPVGYWSFDECQGSVAYDSAVPAGGAARNNGTITIGATGTQDGIGTCTDGDTSNAWYNGRLGKFNSAMSFDGTDDYVSIGTDFGSGAFALAARRDQNLVGMYISTGWEYYTVTINKNQYYHYVVVSDRSAGKTYLYINGVKIGETAKLLDTSLSYSLWASSSADTTGDNERMLNRNSATDLRIGYMSTVDNAFNGLIDEVKIYNYALTTEQIKLDYNQGSAVRFAPITGRP